MANIFRTITTKFYQNRPDFVDDVTKTFGVFFGFAVPTAVHLQNVNAKFDKVVSPILLQNDMNFGPQMASNQTVIFTHLM